MVRYAVRDLHALLLWIDQMVSHTYSQERLRFGNDAHLTAEEKEWVVSQLACIKKHIQSLEVVDAGISDELKIKLQHENLNLGECRGSLLALRRLLKDALEKRVFMYVPLSVAKYAHPYQAPDTQAPQSFFTVSSMLLDSGSLAMKPFGQKVFDAFEDARFDAEQVSLCLIAGASTAAVFHLMRVVEFGVRALGAALGLRRVKDILKPKPGGKLKTPVTRFTPIENVTWEKLHGQLRSKVDVRLSKLRPGPVKDQKSAYYGSILEDFHGFKDAWRNHVMHTRLTCNEKEASRVLSHVERFMQAIASPPWEKGPLPAFYGR
jgi:hypothetical protein